MHMMLGAGLGVHFFLVVLFLSSVGGGTQHRAVGALGCVCCKPYKPKQLKMNASKPSNMNRTLFSSQTPSFSPASSISLHVVVQWQFASV